MTRLLCLLLLTTVGLIPSARAQVVGTAAPDFSYAALGGGEIKLSDHSGKVVFVFLFGNSCTFCLAVGNRTETEVQAVYGSNPSFQAIGLDLWDSSSTTFSVTTFRNRTGITYPLGLKAGSMASLYATTYDRLLVIGPDGIIRYKGNSVVSSTLGAAKNVIDDLLASVALDAAEVPAPAFSLSHAYPNPFTFTTEIGFTLEQAGTARTEVFDLLGRKVAVLADRFFGPGKHHVTWLPEGSLPGGMYIITLEVDGRRESRPALLRR